jgi:capsid assembly protein
VANLTSLTLGTDTGKTELPAAPANVKDGPNGSVVVDPASVPVVAEKPVAKPTYEELEKSYTELRQKMSKDGAPAKEEAKPVVPDATPLTTEQATKVATEAGLDLSKLEAEYTANGGKLTEESLKALEAKGLSRDQVSNYIKGQEAIATQLRTDFTTIAGGEAELKAVLTWAHSNLSEAESKAYNDALDSGNVSLAKIMMEGITSRYVAVNGRDPNFLGGGNAARGGDVRPFQSNAEIAAAFSDPRYKNGDKAYHAEVKARMAATESFA